MFLCDGSCSGMYLVCDGLGKLCADGGVYHVSVFFLSRDTICVRFYKLALVFYLMALFVIGGLEISILLFDRNIWVDILARILIIGLLTLLLNKYVRKSMQQFGRYVV